MLDQLLTPMELLELDLMELERGGGIAKTAPNAWQEWLTTLLPEYFPYSFAKKHIEFWQWVDTVEPLVKPAPFIAIWDRGGGKSTNAEAATVYMGAKGARSYFWYIGETQEQADEHVANIGAMLESPVLEQYYPALAQRKVNKYGHSRGWRRNRLITQHGLIIDALGLDVARRGFKVEEKRPDGMVFDDIDGQEDTQATIDKKKRLIQKKILPAGTPECLVIFIQNLIIPNGIASQLAGVADQDAGFLLDRMVSGPHPAITNLKVEAYQDDESGRIKHKIVGGVATWEGRPLEKCEAQINEWGLDAFLQEAQHQVGDKSTALWSRETINRNRVAIAPNMYKIVVAIDPPATVGQCGIVVCGAAKHGKESHGYTLEDASTPFGASPEDWAKASVAAFYRHECDELVYENNQGGEMVARVIRTVPGGESIPIRAVRATRGKHTRAQPSATLASQGREHHVGVFVELENELCRWTPGDESPNRLDAKVWALTALDLTVFPSELTEQPAQTGRFEEVREMDLSSGSKWRKY